jgi:PUA domain protein
MPCVGGANLLTIKLTPPRVPKERYLSKREVKELEGRLEAAWGALSEGLGEEVKELELAEAERIFIADGLSILEKKGSLMPTLKSEALLSRFASVYVDRGAIPFIIKGAKVMRPGIKAFGRPFRKGEVVVVRDEQYKKAIAVGRALMDYEEAKGAQRGPVVETIHYVGDRAWRALGGG